MSLFGSQLSFIIIIIRKSGKSGTLIIKIPLFPRQYSFLKGHLPLDNSYPHYQVLLFTICMSCSIQCHYQNFSCIISGLWKSLLNSSLRVFFSMLVSKYPYNRGHILLLKICLSNTQNFTWFSSLRGIQDDCTYPCVVYICIFSFFDINFEGLEIFQIQRNSLIIRLYSRINFRFKVIVLCSKTIRAFEIRRYFKRMPSNVFVNSIRWLLFFLLT